MKHHVRVSVLDLTFYPALLAAVMLSLAVLPGCGGGFSDLEKKALATFAFASSDRATAFIPWSKIISARDPEKLQMGREFAVSHQLALAKDSENLIVLCKLIEGGGYSKNRLIEVLSILRDNARGMVQEWTHGPVLLKANGLTDDEWGAFAQSHRHVLESVEETYTRFLEGAKPKPKQKE